MAVIPITPLSLPMTMRARGSAAFHRSPPSVGVKGRFRNEPTVIRIEAFREVGRSFGRLRKDLMAAYKAGSQNLPQVPFIKGMRPTETDPLSLTRVAIGAFLKTLSMMAADERFGFDENFSKDLRTDFGDAVASSLEKFMLLYLTAPSGALPRITYCLLHRIGALGLGFVTLFTIGLSLSLVGSAAENAWVYHSKANSAGQVENVPIFVLRSLLFSKLSYQVLAGVIEQRILKPLLCKYPLDVELHNFIWRSSRQGFLGTVDGSENK